MGLFSSKRKIIKSKFRSLRKKRREGLEGKDNSRPGRARAEAGPKKKRRGMRRKTGER